MVATASKRAHPHFSARQNAQPSSGVLRCRTSRFPSGPTSRRRRVSTHARPFSRVLRCPAKEGKRSVIPRGSTDPLSSPQTDPRIPPRPRNRTPRVMTKRDEPSPAPTSSDRDSVREEANIALCRALEGLPFRPLLLLGSRRNARRAFLEDFAREGESLGFLVSRIDAGGKRIS